MTKRLLLFILFILLLAGILFVFLDTEYKEAVSVKDFQNMYENQQEEELEILGNLSNIAINSLSLVDIEFPENEKIFDFENNELSLKNFAVGETVLIKILSPENKVMEIIKIDENRALRHLAKNKPMAQISILESPQEIKNPCEEIHFEVNLKNTGRIPINYDDLYNENFGYYLVYTVNEKAYNFYNIENFETINPGEEENISITIGEAFNADLIKGDNAINFIWGQKSLYDVEFTQLSNSKIINIILKNNKCE